MPMWINERGERVGGIRDDNWEPEGNPVPRTTPTTESASSATTPVQYRLLRVIEYVGDAEFIRRAIERRQVKGRYQIGTDYIQEAILGETAELLARVNPPLDAEVGR